MKKKTENEKKLERAKVNVHIEWTNVAQLAFFRSLSLITWTKIRKRRKPLEENLEIKLKNAAFDGTFGSSDAFSVPL